MASNNPTGETSMNDPIMNLALRLMAEKKQQEANDLLARYADVKEQAQAAYDAVIAAFLAEQEKDHD
jgi:hypothetical protein